jgi:hypothetical protein
VIKACTDLKIRYEQKGWWLYNAANLANKVHENRCVVLVGEVCETILCNRWGKNWTLGVKRYRNTWRICHIILIFSELANSLLIRGIKLGKMPKLGCLIGLVKHAMWANCISYTCSYLVSRTLTSFYPTVSPFSWAFLPNSDFSRRPSDDPQSLKTQ